MNYKFRDHYSHHFELPLNKASIHLTDRLSPLVLFFSFLFGVMFLMLGSCFLNIKQTTEQTDFENTIMQSAIKAHTFISPEVFGIGLMFLGLAIALVCIFYLCRYKIIIIENGNITVTDHPFIGRAHSFSAPLSDYIGVRLRLKFCQYGLLSQNKFIVELYQNDSNKLVPLYISTSPKNIRSIWKKFALHFNLPPIYISDKGMVSQSMKDLERPYTDVVKDWHLSKNFLVDKTHSADFICKKKGDKQMLKMSHVIYDLYSTLNIAVIAAFTCLLIYALSSHNTLVQILPLGIIIAFYVFLLTSVIYAFLTLVVRDILLISDQKLIMFKKILGFTYPYAVVNFADLRGLDIFFTPTTGRYCLNIITNTKIIKMFNKLSPDDIRWIKCFIISEIIQD